MDNWKELFRPHILERGYDYYETGAVERITPTTRGFQAVVEGTEDYEVEIEIENGQIRDMWCSCPYAEDGNYCKHMAATLYEIEERECGEKDFEDPSLQQAGGCGAEQELSELIRNIPEKELRALLLELAAEDESLKNRIVIRYAENINERQMLVLKKEIDSIAYQYSDRSGFVDWNNAYGYVEAMEDFLYHNVQTLIQKNCFMQAFELINAVFVKVGNQDMDDSGGESAQLANTCYEYWKGILENCGEADKKKMFAWFEKNQSSGIVIDYMEDYIGDFLMNEFHDAELLKRKLAMLDELIERAGDKADCGDHWSAYYGYENNILKRIELMRELRYPEEEIQGYQEKNRRFAAVRKLQISEYLEKHRFREVIGLLEESKEMDKNSPGLVAEYSAQLIDLYEKLGMVQEYKKELLFQVFTCGQRNLDFTEKLKEVCTQEEWIKYREGILEGNTGWSIRYPLMEKEGLYERLLEEIVGSGSVYNLDQYETVLKKKFPEQVRDTYVQYVRKQAEHTAGRKQYKELIRYLKKIAKYPKGDAAVKEIAAEWRDCYYRRSAMMDELRKAGF